MKEIKLPSQTTTRRRAPKRKRQDKPQLPRLRTSERSTVKACEFRWSLTYERSLEPTTAAPALRYGGLIHGALAAYYKVGVRRGPAPADTFTKLYEQDLKRSAKLGFRDEDGKWNEAGELGVAMMENYIDEYGKDDEWEVLVTEYPFQAVVYRNSQRPPRSTAEAEAWKRDGIPQEPWFEYTGILDGVWRHRPSKRAWIPDHKTTDGIGGTSDHPNMPPYLQMDDQAGAYWSFGVEALMRAGLLKKNEKLAGMLYNFMAKRMPDERPYKIVGGRRHFLNKDGSVSKKQPSPFFARQQIFRDEYDREYSKQRAENEYRRIELLRSGELEVTKSPGRFTCSMCSVRDVCELHETGHDWESMLKATMQPWDAYAEHEIREGR